jgi:predicted PhzF superfamily epimerase YddE/YHI9
VLELPDEKTVHGLTPDHRALAAYSERGIIATARAEDPSRGYDFVSRCFFPNVGIDEDPVTGSAHTALAPFWSARLGRPDLTGLQASPRSGRVHTHLHGTRTHLTGHAVTVIEGNLLAQREATAGTSCCRQPAGPPGRLCLSHEHDKQPSATHAVGSQPTFPARRA